METPAYISQWLEDLQPRPLEDLIREPDRTAVFCVDMLVGTCRSGAFASKRINALVDGVVDLLRRAAAMGVAKMVMASVAALLLTTEAVVADHSPAA